MVIETRRVNCLRFDSEMSSKNRESMSTDEDEFLDDVFSDEEDDDDDEFNDCDSGAGSDDFDLLELGETGAEYVQVGDQTCSIPLELYDLSGFGDILSMDVWNDVLTEEERFDLTKFLPDMDQEMFMRTLKELFTGCNMHFGNPLDKLFKLFKGGLCEPRVALYRQGSIFFQNCNHYHHLQKYQNSMVTNFHQIKDAWANCKGYSIEEKIRVLNIMKSQKSLMHEDMEDLETDSEREESVDGIWNRRLMNQKVGQKISHYSEEKLSSAFGYSSREKQVALDTAHYERQNPKGTLKVTGSKKSASKESAGCYSAGRQGMKMRSSPYGFASTSSRYDMASGNNSHAAFRMRNRVPDDNTDGEALYKVAVQSNRSFLSTSRKDDPANSKVSEKYENYGGDKYSDIFTGLPLSSKKDFSAYNRNRTVNQLSDIELLTTKPSKSVFSHEYVNNLESPDNMQHLNVGERVKFEKGHSSNLLLKGNRAELSDRGDPFRHGIAKEEHFSTDLSPKYGNLNVKSKSKFEKNSPDIKVNDRSGSGYRENPKHEDRGAISNQDGRRVVPNVKRRRTFTSDSDSSEQYEDDNPLMRSKWAYPGGASGMKSVSYPKQAKFVKGDEKIGGCGDEISNIQKKMGFHGTHSYISEDIFSMKAKQKNKMDDMGRNFPGPGRSTGYNYNDDWGEWSKFGRNGHVQDEQSERISMASMRPYNVGRMEKIETMPGYSMADNEDDSLKSILAKHKNTSGKMQNKGKDIGARDRHFERSDMQLLECNSSMKKRKVKDDMMINVPEPNEIGTPEKGVSDLSSTVVLAGDDVESKSVKKQFTLITPTVDAEFSFSIIHLLSAVRMAMTTILPDDPVDMGKHNGNNNGVLKDDDEESKQEGIGGELSHLNRDIMNTERTTELNLPSLTVQDIVNRVKSNPGDPCILETQEPLQDLVRGVLKLLSSKSPPLGAKGWKAVLKYEKSTKSWSWIGPRSPSDQETIEEVTSPEAWGLPRKMLVKLVDSFANWLKSSQETLRLIGSLPAPPLTLMQLNIDEKERFKDLRAQKSLNTISQSCDEVRSYFRKEEVLRYAIPDRAFCYTAADGKKSFVAPLRKCGGKLTSKAREHFLLKQDRPPHVTILCLVRDAAARLPGSIGTRADVCTLIRDSQYVVEEVSDAQVNQVVSGALDRLHYERDPCVQFDGERKLWMYLHRDREEEDFEDDGTSSTKKWKRPKKEAPESSERGLVTVANNVSIEGGQTQIEPSSNLIVDPTCMDEDKRADHLYYNDGQNEVNLEGLDQPGIHYSSDLIVDPSSMVDHKMVDHLHYDDRHMEVNIGGLDIIGIPSGSGLNVDPSCMDDGRRVDHLHYSDKHMEVSIEGLDQTGIQLSSEVRVDPLCIADNKRMDHLNYNDREMEVNIDGLEPKQGIMDQGPPMVWQAHGLNSIQENSLLCIENSRPGDFDNGNLGR
nr:PREDICTED: uncharacterized protein LOC108221994 isoform X1 [Daucus carota subsp. sativus]